MSLEQLSFAIFSSERKKVLRKVCSKSSKFTDVSQLLIELSSLFTVVTVVAAPLVKCYDVTEGWWRGWGD